MKLVKPKFEIIEQQEGLEGIYKQIELAGRTCYKSFNNITPESAKKFVDNMINSGHGAMLEHGTVYLKWNRYLDPQYCGDLDFEEKYKLRNKYSLNKYSKVNTIYEEDDVLDVDYVTTNLRVLVENNWLDDLKYLCEPTEFHSKRITVKFTCDRITGESFLRHRAIDEDHPSLEFAVTKEMEKDIDSYARESTRWCNYTKGRFENTIKFIIPTIVTFNYNLNVDYNEQDVVGNTEAECEWMRSCLDAEKHYFKLIELGWKPQNARYALGFSVLSPLVMTGFISDWEHFFELRDAEDAHPDAQALAKPLHEEFIKRGYIN